MSTNKRNLLLAVAFAVTVSAGLTGLSLRGETRESSLDQACAHATWPMIPAECLVGADEGRAVRLVAAPGALAQSVTIGQRFALAFN